MKLADVTSEVYVLTHEYKEDEKDVREYSVETLETIRTKLNCSDIDIGGFLNPEIAALGGEPPFTYRPKTLVNGDNEVIENYLVHDFETTTIRYYHYPDALDIKVRDHDNLEIGKIFCTEKRWDSSDEPSEPYPKIYPYMK